MYTEVVVIVLQSNCMNWMIDDNNYINLYRKVHKTIVDKTIKLSKSRASKFNKNTEYP